jgi:uncharacterized protein (TIGR00730 family)
LDTVRSVCVFCGSSVGNDPVYIEVATALGRAIATRELRLVYGGGRVGLMGVVADAALAAGGEVIGVIPQALVDREIAHEGLAALHVTSSMAERKAEMERLADGFVTLPGGFGTLDELAEMVTWALLGYHRKPIGLLDPNGYFAPLRAFVDGMVTAGFLAPGHRSLLLEGSAPGDLLDAMLAWHPTAPAKWT